MCVGSKPKAPPPIPIPLPIEKLVAETAKDIKPSKQKRTKKKGRDKFNLKNKTPVPTLGGLSRTGNVLNIKRAS